MARWFDLALALAPLCIVPSPKNNCIAGDETGSQLPPPPLPFPSHPPPGEGRQGRDKGMAIIHHKADVIVSMHLIY